MNIPTASGRGIENVRNKGPLGHLNSPLRLCTMGFALLSPRSVTLTG